MVTLTCIPTLRLPGEVQVLAELRFPVDVPPAEPTVPTFGSHLALSVPPSGSVASTWRLYLVFGSTTAAPPGPLAFGATVRTICGALAGLAGAVKFRKPVVAPPRSAPLSFRPGVPAGRSAPQLLLVQRSETTSLKTQL